MKILVLLLLLSFMSDCERRTEVRVEGGNPPRFVLKGSGRLVEVKIFAPEQEHIAQSDPFDDRYELWKIEAEKSVETDKKPIEELAAITYGLVPKGYTQTKPEHGQPPPLEPGKRYSYWFVTENAPWGAGYFEIRAGKAVTVSGP